MKRYLKPAVAAVVVLLASLSLSGCGGGGGGSGGGSTLSGISFTGPTTQAAVDSTNAVELSSSTFRGGNTGVALAGVSAVKISEVNQTGYPHYLSLAQVFTEVVNQVPFIAFSGVSASGAVVTASDSFPGSCSGNPGSVAITINYDDVSGQFSGSMFFNSFCFEGVTINGSSTFQGMYDANAQQFLSFTMSFNSVTGTAGGSTVARLSVISANQYRVEADTNGDGLLDYDSGALNWSAF